MRGNNMIAVFTNTNVHIRANDNPIRFIQKVDIEDKIDSNDDKYTYITLFRLANEDEEVINDMRNSKFSFKLCNCETNSGYVSQEAEVISFKMSLDVKKDINPVEFLNQIITIKTKSFIYVKDVRSETLKNMEKDDLENLKKIIKEQQQKKYTAVLPAVELKKDTVPTVLFDTLKSRKQKNKK